MKKWREFLEGGMKATFFLQKGKHPPGLRADGPPGRWASGQTGLRADGPPGRRASGQMGLRADGRRRTSGIRRSRKQKEGRQKQRERTSGRAAHPEDGRQKQEGST